MCVHREGTDMLALSIVIPVYNGEKTIDALCTSLVYLYGKIYRLQIILVNDGSKDRSDDRCRSLQAAYPEIILYIKLSRNFGEHNAVMAGINQANGDYCVVMDDDLQNPPEEVVKLVAEARKGFDIVYARYKNKKDSLFRNMGSVFNDKMATAILKKPSSLYLSSFKIMNRFLYRELVKYTGPTPYIDAIILRITDNIGSLPLEHRKGKKSRSGYTIGKLVSLWGNMIVSYSLYPLRVIGIVGILLMVFGVVYGLFKAFDDLNTYGEMTHFETLMSANLFFRGLVMAAVSVLGEYVGRIYLMVNRDPQFVIRDRVGGTAVQKPLANLREYRGER